MNRALITDPVHDGATDPVLVWNREEATWWCLFVHRRANTKIGGPARIGRCHGSQVAVASSADGGGSWLYRGTLDLPVERGLNTFWGPDVLHHDGVYHLFVTFIRGVPDDPGWDTHGRPSPWHRQVHHLTSADLWNWTHGSRLDLGTDHAVDPYVHPLPEGGFGLWFKDEARGGSIWRAVSPDLDEWKVEGQALAEWHEGPAVFTLGGYAWMLAESRTGLAVYRSDDMREWRHRGGLTVPGDVPRQPYVQPFSEERAHLLYYAQTGRDSFGEEVPTAGQASDIRAAQLALVGGDLECRTASALTLTGGASATRRPPAASTPSP
ncbi:glycosyl hydrolase [Nonomuraea dietziae]|uniref:Uncharacterized protein n=1 Tax=Nonomuraea dietziae TaxID=65515 RepID=A0A7W5Y5U0_9ACTN|nr:glycosyl hydrolase [Nonomuraea dietziae]MBB3725358.1 hypothetical protein [Nonomuraea dietziae]